MVRGGNQKGIFNPSRGRKDAQNIHTWSLGNALVL